MLTHQSCRRSPVSRSKFTGSTSRIELGTDPAHSGNARKSRGRRNAKHHHANAAWDGDISTEQDSEQFTREILPTLQAVSLRRMADATGLTEGYCSFIRRGLKIPHRRHRTTFATLANLKEDYYRT